MQADILSKHTTSAHGVGSKHIFSESSHVAYQIIGKRAPC